ncbi:hypothetical protein RISK_001053 [Rhodopirellula islandica]|uniref:Signal peptide and transmembrane protein n=1 Tax=Rhodopirellula islandica TaxID=595434 RepID=A0A0J1BL68_RHOIS|nr:hypothetical protein RISK_001053 [Rhodopirellula islandica]
MNRRKCCSLAAVFSCAAPFATAIDLGQVVQINRHRYDDRGNETPAR